MKSKSMLCMAVFLLGACDLGTTVGEQKDGGPLNGPTDGGTDGGGPGGRPDAGPEVRPDAGPISGVKRMFVTSGRYDGNFKTLGAGSDGLDGADRLCTTVAQGAGISGSYKAWLSSSTNDAIDRIADVGPWYQVTFDGTQIKTFNNKANLTGTPMVTIEYTERGDSVLNGCVWTGTVTGGRKSLDTCSSFSDSSYSAHGKVGRASTTDWTDSTCVSASSDSCSNKYHLYCFEQ